MVDIILMRCISKTIYCLNFRQIFGTKQEMKFLLVPKIVFYYFGTSNIRILIPVESNLEI